jgi:hypothetical protein
MVINSRRAILFSIVTFEINYNADEYTEDKLTIMKEYESKSWNENYALR